MLEFYRRGHGHRPCILLHGFLGSGRNLMSLARTWTERDPSLKIWVPDLPGHGGSPSLAEGADLKKVAQTVVEFIQDEIGQDEAGQEAGGSPVHVVGHSLGGRVAIAGSALSDTIGEVTLLDIAPGPVPARAGPGQVVATLVALPDSAASRADMIQHMTDAGISQALTAWLAMNLEPDGDVYRWRIDRERLADFHERTTATDLWDAVERPGSPVKHCVRGAQSEFVSDADVRRLEAAGCRVSTLEGTGHFLHVDALDGLVDLLVAH